MAESNFERLMQCMERMSEEGLVPSLEELQKDARRIAGYGARMAAGEAAEATHLPIKFYPETGTFRVRGEEPN